MSKCGWPRFMLRHLLLLAVLAAAAAMHHHSPAATTSSCLRANLPTAPFCNAAKFVATVMAGELARPLVAAAVGSTPPVNRATAFLDVTAAAEFIKANCPTVLRAVERTGRCFYRGESLKGLDPAKPWLLGYPGDLLDASTYQSAAAADFFRSLDQAAGPGSSLVARGHIAVSSSAAASKWGNVYSVWPLDGASGLQTAYFRRSIELWDPQYALPQGQGRLGPFFWRDPTQFGAFLKDNLVLNSGLEAALSSEHEVVFASAPAAAATAEEGVWSPFVAVPVFLEGRLFEKLGVTPFSSSVSPARAAPMDVDEVRRSSRDRFVVY